MHTYMYYIGSLIIRWECENDSLNLTHGDICAFCSLRNRHLTVAEI